MGAEMEDLQRVDVAEEDGRDWVIEQMIRCSHP